MIASKSDINLLLIFSKGVIGKAENELVRHFYLKSKSHDLRGVSIVPAAQTERDDLKKARRV